MEKSFQPSKQDVKPLRLGGLGVFFHRSQGGSGDLHAHARAILKLEAYAAEVGEGAFFSFVIRVADIIAYHRTFTGKKTFSCHRETFKMKISLGL